MSPDGDKLSKIEEMKSKLFSKSYKTEIEHRDIFRQLEQRDVADSWAPESVMVKVGRKFFMQTSVFKKFFIFSLIFFVLALALASFNFFTGSNTVSNNNIDISVLGNAFVSGGDELPLQINITNKNSSALELVDLVMEYPKSPTGAPEDTVRMRQSLGTIPAGSLRSESVKVSLFGQQGSTIPITISIEYRIEGSNGIFHKDKLYDVNITSTPINLSVNVPESVSPNQDVVLSIKETLNSTNPASDILLSVAYPAGFQFEYSKPTPSFRNNVWDLGDLAPNAEHNITIVGKMVDVFDGDQKTFRISTGSQSNKDKSLIGVVFNSLDQTLTIQKPFINAQLYVNGVYQREYAASAGAPIQGQIQWTNNLNNKINNLSIVAKISGNALNNKTITSPEGFYDSSTNSIIWDKNSKSNFAEVDPGTSGVLTFSLSPLSLYSGIGGIITNPSINIDVSISGKQETAGGALSELKNSESKVIHIITDTGFTNKALYYSGAFKNTGPIPPKAGKETTYTVVWTLTNTANSISKAQISSSLPPLVRFVGPISPAEENLSYNASTKEILWNIGNIPRGTGISQGTRQVSFQVAFTPSLSQIGNSPNILNSAVLTGQDDFANVPVRVSKGAITTELSNDPGFTPGSGIVAE